MPRSVAEWIGKNPDAKVPDRVRLRIWRRQLGDSNFAICPLSGAILRSTSECQLDHEKALIEGGEHRESNLRFVFTAAHREKTAGEVARKASVDARAKSHAGIGKSHQTALHTPHEAIRARREARSRDRQGPGKLPVPGVRLLAGFEPASPKGMSHER